MVYGGAQLGWWQKFQANVSQDIDKLEEVHKNASKANRSNPNISLGTHTRKIDVIRTTRSELKMCNHGKCSCCANARETLARFLKWARYACAPTYERNVPSSIPTTLYAVTKMI